MKNLRRASFTSSIMEYIDSVVVRKNKNKDGYYESAYFELWGKQYKMTSEGVLYFSDGRKVAISYVKSGIYPEYRLTGEDSFHIVNIKAYHLSLLCLTDWFYEAYMSDNSLVVNHTVVEKYRYDFIGNYTEYHSASKPMQEVSFNPMYLEVISRKSNLIHGRFVNDNELFGVFVSALDIDALKIVLNKLYELNKEASSESKLSAIEKFYREKGETKKLIFA